MSKSRKSVAVATVVPDAPETVNVNVGVIDASVSDASVSDASNVPDTFTSNASNVPEPTTAETAVATLRAAGHNGTVPLWFVPMVCAIRIAFDTVPAADRKTASFDTWLSAWRTTIDVPAHGHAFTGNGGSAIAATQNAIYVAFACAGIRSADVSMACGMSAWRAVIGPTRCSYETKSYFRSTLSDVIAGRHNDTPGIATSVVSDIMRGWVNGTV